MYKSWVAILVVYFQFFFVPRMRGLCYIFYCDTRLFLFGCGVRAISRLIVIAECNRHLVSLVHV